MSQNITQTLTTDYTAYQDYTHVNGSLSLPRSGLSWKSLKENWNTITKGKVDN